MEIRARKEEGDAGSDARLRLASDELTFLLTPTHISQYTHSAQGAGLGGCQVEDDCANLIMPNNQKLSSK